jgi:hypothetical protein
MLGLVIARACSALSLLYRNLACRAAASLPIAVIQGAACSFVAVVVVEVSALPIYHAITKVFLFKLRT